MALGENSVTYASLDEWNKKGVELFGEDRMKWKFVCPACEKVQTPEDFRPYKDKGADPNDAYQQCIGRSTGGRKGPQKCDWAAYGLFSGPSFVINGEKKIAVFNFYEGDKANG